MTRSALLLAMAVLVVLPSSATAQDTVHYGGGKSPTERRAGLVMSIARSGDAVVSRLGIPLSCSGTNIPQLVVRAKGAVTGDTFAASGRARVLARLDIKVQVEGRFVGDTIEGRVYYRPVRRRGGPRCGGRVEVPVTLRAATSPVGAPVPAPPSVNLRGVSDQTASGVRLPVLVSTTSTGKVMATWLAQSVCPRGSLPVDNFTPPTAVDAAGNFARSERYRIRFSDGTTEHYRVRFSGTFRADGVTGTLRARIRLADRRGRTIARCDSGVRPFTAA